MPWKNHEKQLESQRRWYKNNREKQVKWSQKRREALYKWFYEYKTTLKCIKCGESESACLDFHHRNPEEKENTIQYMLRYGYSKKRILEEMEKCDVVCANCHRKIHRDMKRARILIDKETAF